MVVRAPQGQGEWKRSWREFSEQLAGLGLCIKEVAGDGNCLFRSISDQLEGNEGRHGYYRHLCRAGLDSTSPTALLLCGTEWWWWWWCAGVQYMLDHPDEFAPFLEEPLQQVVACCCLPAAVCGV